ncbi:hypothetical protein ACQP2P_14865 [Dactylosporangium sp. CA-139114]
MHARLGAAAAEVLDPGRALAVVRDGLRSTGPERAGSPVGRVIVVYR